MNTLAIIIKGSMLLWSAFDWGHHTDIKQFSEKQANKCIPKSHCSPHIYSVKQSVHYQSISSSLFCSVKWAMSSLHPSHCSLWGHSRNTRTLTNPRLSETVSSRPKEIESERASEREKGQLVPNDTLHIPDSLQRLFPHQKHELCF